jgi:hypothetical protein
VGRLVALTVAGTLYCWTSLAQTAEPPTLENAPPVVIKTEPQSGQSDIEPGRSEISITFSKPMRDGSWSWSQISPESFPAKAGEPHFLQDQRTCVLPVVLESAKTYAIGLNIPPFQNFQDREGHKAMPYLLVFRTK